MYTLHPSFKAFALGAAVYLCGALGTIASAQATAPVIPTTASNTATSSVSAAHTAIATVTLVVGAAQRIQPGGQQQTLQTGLQLAEQDRIITGNDGLVMLVFTDSGRVAIRPDTELIIHHYRVDPSGADTRLDLELLRGTIRQISGQAAKLQPERYRLNTPIAAIGVRGTDFLARVEQQQIQTYVHEGTIIVLPPLSDCGMQRAPCNIWAAVNASDAGQYVAVNGNGLVTRSIASPDDVSRLFGIQIAAASSAHTPPPSSHANAADADLQANIGLRPLGRDLDRNLAPADAAPTPPTNPILLPPSQLVWGRFSDPTQLPLSIPVSFQQAANGRHVTVGQLGQYALWRDNPVGQLDRHLRGQADFALTASEAFYTRDGQTLTVQINTANLSVNFDNATFTTELGLAGAGLPANTLQVAGRINDEGIFTGRNAQSQRVAGALSHNAAEAGYFFTAPGANAAQYEGITNWRVK